MQHRDDKGQEMIPGVEVSYEGLCDGDDWREICNEYRINNYDVFGINFGGLVQHQMTFTLSDLFAGEYASYRTYLEAQKIDEGTVEGNDSGYANFEITTNIGFDTIEFFVANEHIDSTNFIVQKVEYCAAKSCDASSMIVGRQHGDPHIESFDGFHWSCQGAGHFRTFLGQDAETSDTLFEIQSIFAKSTGNRQITVTDAIVIDPVSEDTPQLTIAAKMDPETDECYYAIYDSLQETEVPDYCGGSHRWRNIRSCKFERWKYPVAQQGRGGE